MATESGGWTLRRDERTGIYTVRFRHAGKRVHRSTGQTDRAAAQREAARIYAEVVSGRRRKAVGRAAPDLEDICGAWLVEYRAGHAPETAAEFERYCAATIIPFFGSAAGFTTLSCEDYATRRLGQVTASTVRKELSAIRSLVAWMARQGYLPEPAHVPSVPKRATGKRVIQQVRVMLSREQIEALLAALPERGRARKGDRGGEKIPVRAAAIVFAETGIRRSTLWRLRTPLHYHRGADVLAITPDVDKAREGRPLPLSALARAALDAACPDEGLIFGRVDLRHWLASASKDIGLPPHLAGRVSHHDLRHAFLTHLAESGASIGGMQYLAGHRHASTTALYVHPGQRAAEEALRVREAAAGTPIGTPRKKKAPKPKPRSRRSA